MNLTYYLRTTLKLTFIIFGKIFLLFPKYRNLWVFGATYNQYTDNAKYLFEFVSTSVPEKKAVWISGCLATVDDVRRKGFSAYHRNSLQGILILSMAEKWFYNSYFDDIHPYIMTRATKINLWHGVAMKKIEFDITQGELGKVLSNPSFSEKWISHRKHFNKADFLIVASIDYGQRIFAGAFRLDKTQCLPLGFPRNDVLFESSESRMSSLTVPSAIKYSLQSAFKDFKTVLYMPTFRDHDLFFIYKNQENIALFADRLFNLGIRLIVKLHPNEEGDFDILINHHNIIWLPLNFDVYPILPDIEALITDYSSILFDYQILGKKVYLLLPDHKDYLTYSRELYVDINRLEGAVISLTFEQLCAQLSERSIFNDNTNYHDKGSSVFDYEDGNSSKRISDFFG